MGCGMPDLTWSSSCTLDLGTLLYGGINGGNFTGPLFNVSF